MAHDQRECDSWFRLAPSNAPAFTAQDSGLYYQQKAFNAMNTPKAAITKKEIAALSIILLIYLIQHLSHPQIARIHNVLRRTVVSRPFFRLNRQI